MKKGLGRAVAPRFAWLLGAALLGTVIVADLRFSEWRGFARIAEQAHPWWLVLAVVFQAATYMAHGQIWRNAVRAAGFPLSMGLIYRLSLAKLFMDQALPSGGLSGTVLLARALEQRGIPRRVVMAAVVVTTATYYAVYVFCLTAALVALIVLGKPHKLAILAVIVRRGRGLNRRRMAGCRHRRRDRFCDNPHQLFARVPCARGDRSSARPHPVQRKRGPCRTRGDGSIGRTSEFGL